MINMGMRFILTLDLPEFLVKVHIHWDVAQV